MDKVEMHNQTRKTTAIIPVLETGVSWHHGGPCNPLGTLQQYRFEGFKGGFHYAEAREVLLSDSRCNFFPVWKLKPHFPRPSARRFYIKRLNSRSLHANKYVLNPVNPNQIWIVITFFSIDLATNGLPFAAKAIGKW